VERSADRSNTSTRSCRGGGATAGDSGRLTKRKNYDTIPRSALLAEIGTRVSNVRNYQQALGAAASQLPKFTEFEKPWIDANQPLRTDCELMLNGVPFVDVEIEA
jgi:hypothetical protein